MKSKLLTPEEVAELLNVSPVTVKAWLRRGKLHGTKLGGNMWRISNEALEEFIKSGQKQVNK